jgi:hypothetical protein
MGEHRWGPFTGRQLMVMFLGLLATIVVVPGTVYAVDAYSNVAIQDPVSGAKAKVSNGRVLVGDGIGALTVDGTVVANHPRPMPFPLGASSSNSGSNVAEQTYTVPTGKDLVVTSVSGYVARAIGDNTPVNARFILLAADGSNTFVNLDAQNPAFVTYQAPVDMLVTSSLRVTARRDDTTGYVYVETTLWGYLVPEPPTGAPGPAAPAPPSPAVGG